MVSHSARAACRAWVSSVSTTSRRSSWERLVAMIPLDVDALLAQIRGKALYAGVTGVTEVTPSVIPSTYAGQEPLTAVTQADPPKGNRGNTPVVGAPDGEAVTPVTQRPLTLGNRGVVPQGIDTARVSKTVTHV